MKVELEFELLKDVPLIHDLIAGHVYAMDCVDKSKDVKARVVDEPSNPLAGMKLIGYSCEEGACGRIHDEQDGPYMTPVYVLDKAAQAIEWPTLITLPVRHMPEEVKP